MIKYLIILVGLFFFISCASSPKIQTDTDQGGKKISGKYDESFDPLTLDDDDIEITREADDMQVSQTGDESDHDQVSEKVLMHEVEGYRVQILATRGIEAATLQQQKAIDRFSDKNYKIYLIYEAPLYRLRMGDATNRKDAEAIRDLAKKRGYDEAFIVRSKVMAPETSKLDGI